MIDPRREAVLIRNKETGQFDDKTGRIARYGRQSTGEVDVVYAGDSRVFSYRPDRVHVVRSLRPVDLTAGRRVEVDGDIWRSPTEVRVFTTPTGNWYRIFYGKPDEKYGTYPESRVRVVISATQEPPIAAVYAYWRDVVARLPGDDALVRPFDKLGHFLNRESALARFLAGAPIEFRPAATAPIFPFRCNLSQRRAVENALTHTVSVIEGPPGTGKTETILNIIANVIAVAGKTVGVVAYSNAAVDNVRDKLESLGFGHVIANLGRNSKRTAFLATQATRNSQVDAIAAAVPAPPPWERLTQLDQRLRRLQDAERTRAQCRQEIDAYRLEQRHFQHHLQRDELPDLDHLPLLRRSAEGILDYLAETEVQRLGVRPGLVRRLRNYFRFGPLRGLDPEDTTVVLRLQQVYYTKRIGALADQLRQLDDQHQELSVQVLQADLGARYRDQPRRTYPADVFWSHRLFTEFIADYPVLLSTCHALSDCLAGDYLLDYLIIDEASQVDVLTAALALARCRNLVVVGDQLQLPPIVREAAGIAPPRPAYDVSRNLLSSLAELHGDALPSTLLREHYRCDPMIIGFCNKRYYSGQLIPYRTRGHERPMTVWRTAEGNHMRQHQGGGRSNQREVDVIMREVIPDHCAGVATADIGVTTPYRRQVDKVTDALIAELEGIEADTVHKYQGRQKPVMILTTVLDETRRGRTGLSFVDDPQLINVAVSRAINRFILVTNNHLMPTSRHISDLVGYIRYHNLGEDTRDSAVVSMFDLLYRDYSARLQPLADRLRNELEYRSEDIAWTVLHDILAEDRYSHLIVRPQVLVKNLLPDLGRLSPAQAAYVGRRASVDFVVYNRTTNEPRLAIEVDGFAFHENKPDQLRRDALKNEILEAHHLPLLRLPTTGSEEERGIRRALDQAEADWARRSAW